MESQVLDGLLGNTPEMRKILKTVYKVAPTNSSVLITGESGSGKEFLANVIHRYSKRSAEPFVAVNCGAIPENLVESELFGSKKGSYTGSTADKKGLFESANGGTLFLDEVGDLSAATQVKLLRFLQERTFSRVGSNEELHSDVRFLAATSRNLEELMEKKLFREDLFYRLNIFPIVMPDLAKRQSDIILLAEHFIEKMNLRYGKKIVRLSTTAINLLMSYHWPGNVRELENCIERAVLTATDDCIHSYNLPPSLQTSLSTGTGKIITDHAPLDVMMCNYEKELITEAIKRNDGNISAAGRELGISPRMMNYRMNKLGLITK
jgi:Nif-specific regulatory protein